MSENLSQDYIHVKCNLCEEDYTEVYAANRSTDGNVLHNVRVRCRKCGLVYSNPQATDTKMVRFYSEIYPEIQGPITPIYDETFFADPWNKTKKMKPGNFLDVGCNYGFRVKAAEQLGWEVHGVEVSKLFCDYARNSLKLKNIFQGTLFKAAYDNSYFDYVVLWHVLEHVPSPKDLLEEIQRVLKPGGILLIGVPNIFEPLNQITRLACSIKRVLPSMATPDHHTYEFTPSTLRKMLKKAAPYLKVQRFRVYYEEGDLKSIGKEANNWKGALQIKTALVCANIMKNRVGNHMCVRLIKEG